MDCAQALDWRKWTMKDDTAGGKPGSQPRLKTILFIAIMVVAGPLGNVLLSRGMKQVRPSLWPLDQFLATAFHIFAAPSIWMGIGSLITFFLANILVLSWVDYSFVQPASSIGYGVSALLGYIILGGRIILLRWLGIAVICTGVFIVGRTAPRTTKVLPGAPKLVEAELERS